MWKCEERDDHMKTFNVSEFCRLSWPSNQDEACEVLEDPTEEIIAGHINEIVVRMIMILFCL